MKTTTNNGTETTIISNEAGATHWLHQLYPSLYTKDGVKISKEVKMTFTI